MSKEVTKAIKVSCNDTNYFAGTPDDCQKTRRNGADVKRRGSAFRTPAATGKARSPTVDMYAKSAHSVIMFNSGCFTYLSNCLSGVEPQKIIRRYKNNFAPVVLLKDFDQECPHLVD